MTLHCRRLDPHPTHQWRTHEPTLWQQRHVTCPGRLAIEGGARKEAAA